MSGYDWESKFAARTRAIEASGIRRIFDLAANLKNPVNLSIGQPDFDVAPEIIEKCAAAMRAGKNRYVPSPGIPPLRDKVMRLARETDGWKPEDVVITSGTSGALTLAILALAGPGDDILVPDPYFVSYPQLVSIAGGRSVFYNTYPDFTDIVSPIKKSFTERTKLVIINSPANPTGVCAGEEQIREVVEFVESRGAVVLSDEVYSAYSFDSPHATAGGFGERVLVADGLSKSKGMTGWRLGWALGPRAVINEMIKLQQFTFVHAPSMVQYAALEALEPAASSIIDDYRRKRDEFCGLLKEAGYRFTRPSGAFYVFPKAPGGNGTAFVEAALKENLLVIPGGVFSREDTHFRISFAAADTTLRKGAEILAELRKKFSA